MSHYSSLVGAMLLLSASGCRPASTVSDTASAENLRRAAEQHQLDVTLTQIRATLQPPFELFCKIPFATSYSEALHEQALREKAQEIQKVLDAQGGGIMVSVTKNEAWGKQVVVTLAGAADLAALGGGFVEKGIAKANGLFSGSKALAETWLTLSSKVGHNAAYKILVKFVPKIAETGAAMNKAAESISRLATQIPARASQFTHAAKALGTVATAYSAALAVCDIFNLVFAILDAEAAKAGARSAREVYLDATERYCNAYKKKYGRRADDPECP